VEISNREIKFILEKTVARSWKDWVDKLDYALRAYCATFKTPIGTTPFRLICGKACHLPVELEHKAYWAIKHFNFDLKSTVQKRMLQLNELEEIRLDAYESSKLYKERVKTWHDRFINKRDFRDSDLVLLFNSRLKLFPRKLRSRWSGPFKVLKVCPYGAIEIGTDTIRSFKVNGSRLKHYVVGDPIEGKVSYSLPDVPPA